jgi:hypothetical protein
MKLRIQGNSVRFRLSKPEVEKFGKEGYIEEITDFGAQTLTYALNRVRDHNDLYLDYNDGVIVLNVPSELSEKWISSDLVGIEHTMDIDGYGRMLHILLEKDFKCLGKEGEADQKDKFENPKTTC